MQEDLEISRSKLFPKWNNLVPEFHDIFDPPAMPVDRDTVHHIELLSNAEPHYRC